MAATIRRLRTKPERVADEDAAQLRLILERRPELLPRTLVSQVVLRLDQRAPSADRWPFVMMNADGNAQVVEWLAEHSCRPVVAMRLWSKLFLHMVWDTGEIVQTRDELADLVGILPRHVSEVMGELESIGAIIRRRERVAGMRGPGPVRYFVSPRIGTHLVGAARDRAQAEAPPLLGLLNGGAES